MPKEKQVSKRRTIRKYFLDLQLQALSHPGLFYTYYPQLVNVCWFQSFLCSIVQNNQTTERLSNSTKGTMLEDLFDRKFQVLYVSAKHGYQEINATCFQEPKYTVQFNICQSPTQICTDGEPGLTCSHPDKLKHSRVDALASWGE